MVNTRKADEMLAHAEKLLFSVEPDIGSDAFRLTFALTEATIACAVYLKKIAETTDYIEKNISRRI